jgi:hypothetical protein
VAVSLTTGRESATPGPAAKPLAVQPGPQADGFTQLPNRWRLRPAGTHSEIGDFPVHCELHPAGKFLAILHCGYRGHEVVIVSLVGGRNRIVSRAVVDQAFYGMSFAPDDKTLYFSGGEYEVAHALVFADG